MSVLWWHVLSLLSLYADFVLRHESGSVSDFIGLFSRLSSASYVRNHTVNCGPLNHCTGEIGNSCHGKLFYQWGKHDFRFVYGSIPPDKPVCGIDDRNCSKSVWWSFLFIMLSVILVMLLIRYRKALRCAQKKWVIPMSRVKMLKGIVIDGSAPMNR